MELGHGKKKKGGRQNVPWHIPSLPRPQEQYNIKVNNSNQPFEHVWLERSEDGSRFVHPMEKLSVLDFVDDHVTESVPETFCPIGNTPFKLVEGVKELRELATKLRNVNEFAVDLEHNQYRSFQGLTCLMQISTRTEDFVIDTLKLRVHVGPHLREVFKDPSKRKVMHGADRDILWLQRDFGIYVCNLFDTGQASRVMQLERKSLEYLLHRFCGINANKEYQNSDWRLRPLPDEMLKYAREDTHYLLHIYDLMKSMLLSAPLPDGNRKTLLVEICKRSNEICMQLYDKELLRDFSFLHIYGLQEANFNLQQLSIVSALYKWRDDVARREDESTGFILPNKILLEIAREMPPFSSKLRHLVKIKSPCVDRNLQDVIRVIRSSVKNASEIEQLVELFKKGQQEKKYEQQNEAVGHSSVSLPQVEDPMVSTISQTSVFHGSYNSRVLQGTEHITGSLNTKDSCAKIADRAQLSCQFAELGKCWEQKRLPPLPLPEFGRFFKPSNTFKTSNEEKMENGSIKYSKSAKPDIVHKTGNPSSNKKFDCNGGSTIEQDKAGIKIPQCEYSTSVPFHSYGSQRPLEPSPDGCINHSYQEAASLRDEREKPSWIVPATDGDMKFREQIPCHPENSFLNRLRSRIDTSGHVSPRDLSSSSRNCIQMTSEGRRSESTLSKPFRESQEGRTVDDVEVRTSGGSREVCVREGSLSSPGHGKEGAGELQQSLWQQAFPPGNRSMGR